VKSPESLRYHYTRRGRRIDQGSLREISAVPSGERRRASAGPSQRHFVATHKVATLTTAEMRSTPMVVFWRSGSIFSASRRYLSLFAPYIPWLGRFDGDWMYTSTRLCAVPASTRTRARRAYRGLDVRRPLICLSGLSTLARAMPWPDARGHSSRNRQARAMPTTPHASHYGRRDFEGAFGTCLKADRRVRQRGGRRSRAGRSAICIASYIECTAGAIPKRLFDTEKNAFHAHHRHPIQRQGLKRLTPGRLAIS